MPSLDLGASRIAALINLSSGSCGADCEKRLRAVLAEASLAPADVACVEGRDVDGALRRIAQARPDVLIVLGGDGTIRAAAERCGKAGIALVPLPGGTMNMLPKAIYGARDWPQALADTLAAPVLKPVGGGEVDGKRFFCAGIFGSPALWAEVREAARANRALDMIRKARDAFRRRFSRKVGYRFGPGPDLTGEAETVAVLCPLISASLPSQARTLEAAALDLQSSIDAFRLAVNALFADWRRDETVTAAPATTVELSSRTKIPAILDGELVTLPRRVQVRYVERCFDALAPG
ncbi:MAG: NAD(+)/NADH kinase [Alphaproteobacteria bacterium]|nr:NAD(+)/NADH kinase [Alphaproteobacteria bacterium]